MTNWIRESIDRNLSGLTFTQEDRMRVFTAIKGAKPLLRKKLRISFALAMLLVLLAAVALAVGLSYSARYKAASMAQQALTEKYQLTQEMIKMFNAKETREQAGKTSMIFSVFDGSQFVNAEAMGQYAVTQNTKGDVTVSWSHDDVDPATWENGDLHSPVWGAPQLQALLERHALYQQWKAENENIHALPMPQQQERYQELYKLVEPLTVMERPVHSSASQWATPEEAAQWDDPSAVLPPEAACATPMPGDLPAEQLSLFACQAMAEKYGLTKQALDAYQLTVWYQYNENGDCRVGFNGSETTGYVLLRATDGEIQEVWMESALGSNG
ncbi:MAG: hypothetical protein RR301_10810 [Clostridia bacterium]